MENGTEEGLGDSSDSPYIDYPLEVDMEAELEHTRTNNVQATARRYLDQMVPSITSSLFRTEEEEISVDIGSGGEDSSAEVPVNVNLEAQTHGGTDTNSTILQFTPSFSEGESSSTYTERGLVPVWSPSSTSTRSEHVVAHETSIRSHVF